jgi:hypothetical protein
VNVNGGVLEGVLVFVGVLVLVGVFGIVAVLVGVAVGTRTPQILKAEDEFWGRLGVIKLKSAELSPLS